MDLDLEELAAVIELLDKADFTDFLYEKGDLRIAVRRGGPQLDQFPAADRTPTAAPLAQQAGVQPARHQPVAAQSTAVAPEAPAASPSAVPRATAPRDTSPRATGPRDISPQDNGTGLIRSSMLGTFYRSPKPGEPPFVEVGDKVEADSVVGIVEVMKLMNSVAAGVSGEITAVHADNGDLVEFDQPLFSVRPLP